MSFADLLVEATRGLTQAQIAARSGLNQAHISRLLRQNTRPRIDTVLKLQRAFPKLRKLLDQQAT